MIQPPKPSEKHPNSLPIGGKDKSSKVPPPEKRKLLQPVDRDIINAEE